MRTSERDALRQFLAREGIATGIHYPIPIHRSEAYRRPEPQSDVAPVASALAGEILSLPIFPGLGRDQVQRIADAVVDFAAQRERSAVLAGR